jgi:hypothetical protein
MAAMAAAIRSAVGFSAMTWVDRGTFVVAIHRPDAVVGAIHRPVVVVGVRARG